MSRLSVSLTLGVLIAVAVSAYFGGFAFTRVWAAGLAASGGYVAWTGRVTYGTRGGPVLGELKGLWVRIVGTLIVLLAAAIVIHSQATCSIITADGQVMR
jgi:hypothetical protein